MWSNDLTDKEADYMKRIINQVKDADWIQPLLKSIDDQGSLTSKVKSLLFELRVAHALHFSGKRASYEVRCGVGNSTVDFRVDGNPTWFMEIVSVGASEAARGLVKETKPLIMDGDMFARTFSQGFSSDAPCIQESPVGEMILVQQKLGEKVLNDDKPWKFPNPQPDVYHVILVDMRGFLDRGEESLQAHHISEYDQIAYGPQAADPKIWPPYVWSFPGGLPRRPLAGLFDLNNRCQRFAPRFREVVHFIGFILESEYKAGEISRVAHYCWNPHLFGDRHSAGNVLRSFPLMSGGMDGP